MHKYTIENQSTEKIIFFIALVSISITPLVSNLLSIFITIINITITNSLTFTILFFITNFSIGRVKWISKIFGVPYLRGKWICRGKSFNHLNKNTIVWDGVITIEQTWQKIVINLKTENSTSNSVSIIGNIKKIHGQGYLLTYVYENEPRQNQKELQTHKGVCEIIFDADLSSGDADYFNKHRATYGTMTLKRSK